MISTDGEATRRVVQIELEGSVVRGIGRLGRLTNGVIDYLRAWLVRQGVDTAHVIQHLGIVCYMVTTDEVVAHTCVMCRPSPPHADAAVVQVAQCVVYDGGVAHVTATYAHSSPVFIGSVADGVTQDEQTVAIGCLALCQTEGTVHLHTSFAEGAGHKCCSADVGETAFCHAHALDAYGKV